jgi:hypothetical protein
MAKVKVVSATLTKDGYFLIVDSQGRLWRSGSLHGGNWSEILLPDAPK